jgi:hypothetical protein
MALTMAGIAVVFDAGQHVVGDGLEALGAG